MCAPAIGLVAGIASAAVGAIGAQQQANAQAEAEEQQAKMDEHNAKVAKINARSNRWEGYQRMERIGAEADQRRGSAIAAASKGGVDPGYGSAALVIFGEGREAEFADKSNMYLQAESGAIGEENKAKSLEFSAAGHRAAADNHRKAGKIAAAGSFLSGIGGAMKGGMKTNEPAGGAPMASVGWGG